MAQKCCDPTSKTCKAPASGATCVAGTDGPACMMGMCPGSAAQLGLIGGGGVVVGALLGVMLGMYLAKQKKKGGSRK